MTHNDWLIATDLDGTLLDDSYPETHAISVVTELLRQSSVHVALASSKTLAELLHMVRELDRLGPRPFLVFENGGGWAWPDGVSNLTGQCSVHGYRINRQGASYSEIRTALRSLAHQGFRFRGFADMEATEVSERTGLSKHQAGLAKRRLTSEPLVWEGNTQDRKRFAATLKAWGFDLVRGGRFYHVTSGADKQQAIDQIKTMLHEQTGSSLRVVACGDAPNDATMLRAADHAVVFPQDGRYLHKPSSNVTHAPIAGPKAWLTAVRNAIETGQRS